MVFLNAFINLTKVYLYCPRYSYYHYNMPPQTVLCDNVCSHSYVSIHVVPEIAGESGLDHHVIVNVFALLSACAICLRCSWTSKSGCTVTNSYSVLLFMNKSICCSLMGQTLGSSMLRITKSAYHISLSTMFIQNRTYIINLTAWVQIVYFACIAIRSIL